MITFGLDGDIHMHVAKIAALTYLTVSDVVAVLLTTQFVVAKPADAQAARRAGGKGQ
jgi:hypothetical protein